jgi:hypothetical protein
MTFVISLKIRGFRLGNCRWACVDGMELLGERPVWSMSGGELLTTLDTLDAEIARLQTDRLHVIAQVDETGYPEQLGAHDTVQLLTFRYRLNGAEARRDVRMARALPKYHAVGEALANLDLDLDATDDPPCDDLNPDTDATDDESGLTRNTNWVLRPPRPKRSCPPSNASPPA